MTEAPSGPPPPLSSQVRRGALVGALVGVSLLLYLVYPSIDLGVHLRSLRVVPPAPGACVGRVEATAVNWTSRAVHVGGLWVGQDGENDDPAFHTPIFPLKERGPAFAWFATDSPRLDGENTLEPWTSRVMVVGMVRIRDGAAARVSILGSIYTDRVDEEPVTLTTPPVDIDPAAWPLPKPMGSEALDRALGEGHELAISVAWSTWTGGSATALAIGPGGRARVGSNGFKASGTLTPDQRERLRAAVRAAPFAAFRADPKYVGWSHAYRVRLLVAAGPAAFAAGSDVEDFSAAGLDPLLEHLRLLLRDLPDAGGGR